MYTPPTRSTSVKTVNTGEGVPSVSPRSERHRPEGDLADAPSSGAWPPGSPRAKGLISGVEGSAAIFVGETDTPGGRMLVDPAWIAKPFAENGSSRPP